MGPLCGRIQYRTERLCRRFTPRRSYLLHSPIARRFSLPPLFFFSFLLLVVYLVAPVEVLELKVLTAFHVQAIHHPTLGSSSHEGQAFDFRICTWSILVRPPHPVPPPPSSLPSCTDSRMLSVLSVSLRTGVISSPRWTEPTSLEDVFSLFPGLRAKQQLREAVGTQTDVIHTRRMTSLFVPEFL